MQFSSQLSLINIIESITHKKIPICTYKKQTFKTDETTPPDLETLLCWLCLANGISIASLYLLYPNMNIRYICTISFMQIKVWKKANSLRDPCKCQCSRYSRYSLSSEPNGQFSTQFISMAQLFSNGCHTLDQIRCIFCVNKIYFI